MAALSRAPHAATAGHGTSYDTAATSGSGVAPARRAHSSSAGPTPGGGISNPGSLHEDGVTQPLANEQVNLLQEDNAATKGDHTELDPLITFGGLKLVDSLLLPSQRDSDPMFYECSID